jgi:hypothetical protein
MNSSVTQPQYAGGRVEKLLLRVSWEAELFGVGMFETLAQLHPAHAESLTACAAMERHNARCCEPFGRDAGIGVTPARAESLQNWGAALARRLPTFSSVARLMIIETPVADLLYRRLGRSTRSPGLKRFADELYDHENAMRDWFRSELKGDSDGAEKVFAYLQRHGVTREEAVNRADVNRAVRGAS